MEVRSAKRLKPTRAITLPEKAVESLANSIFHHLQQEGCKVNDIISVSSQLLSLVTTEIKGQNKD